MEASPDVAVRFTGVTYRYGQTERGVHEISMTIPRGVTFALLGANGAGKTTLMRLMTGLLKPQQGTLHFFERDFESRRRENLRAIGSLIETPSLYEQLSGYDHLRVFASYTGTEAEGIGRVLALVGLSAAAGQKIRTYSLGMKQRLGIATALLHDPAVLVLDEPTNGLDPEGIVAMREFLRRIADSGKTVVVSSHLLAEVEKFADRIAILADGRLRFQGTGGELAGMTRERCAIRLRVASPKRAREILGIATDVAGIDEPITLTGADREAADAVRRLVAAGIDVYEVTPEASSLEDDFLSILQRGEK